MMSNDELGGVAPVSRMERDIVTKVAAAMSEENAMTADEIAAAANMKRTEVLKALKHLVDAGAVVRVDGRYRRLSSDERG